MQEELKVSQTAPLPQFYIARKICREIIKPFLRIWHFCLPDSVYLKTRYRTVFKKRLDFNNCVTFNEKLQWLKLHDRNPLYTTLADKYGVRKHIADTIGEEYLVPLLGVWEKFDHIDFQKLPSQFVLKSTHDSGSAIICNDSNTFDKKTAKKRINRHLRKNYYYGGREWPYKNITPRIIAEQYLCDDSGVGLTDYKFFCFKGYVDCVMVCIDRHLKEPKFYFFDREWNLLRLNIRGKEAPVDFTLPKPHCIDKMFQIAQLLSTDMPFVRIDLYESNKKIYFGEFSFHPQSGWDVNLLPETDMRFGNLIFLEDGV